jgi:hypothetical protein
MALMIPSATAERLERIERELLPVRDYDLPQRLGLVHQDPTLSEDERKGAWAEAAAFNFMRNGGGGQSVWNTYFGPVIRQAREDGTEFRAPDVAEIDTEIIDHWKTRAETCRHPVLKARYADLIWDLSDAATSNRPDADWARVAIDSYIETIKKTLYAEPMIGVEYGKRALDLSLRLGDTPRVESARDAMFLLDEQLSSLGQAGTSTFLFDNLYNNKHVALSQIQEERVVQALEDLLRAKTRSGVPDGPWAAQGAAERLAKHYKRAKLPQEVARVIKAFAGALERVAEKGNGIQAIHWLDTAQRAYRAAGLIEDADRVLVLGKQRGLEAESELKRHSVSVPIDRAKVDAFYDEIAEGTPFESMTRLAAHFVPSAQNSRDLLEEIRKRFPLQAMVPVSVLSEGHVAAQAGPVDSDPDGRLRFQISQDIAFQSTFLSEAIDLVRKKQKLDTAHVIDFLYSSPLFEEDRRHLLEHGLNAYFRDDFITTVHVLIPQIEHCLRLLVALSGVPTDKPIRDGAMQVKNLNDLLREDVLKSVFGQDRQLYLLVFLADSRGHNIRNHVSHGLLGGRAFNRFVTDRVLHCLLILGLIRRPQQTEPGVPKTDQPDGLHASVE